MSETIEDLVLRLARERGAGKTICPTEAAKAAAEQRGEENWNARLPAVKAAAARVAKRGGVAIYRKGKPVDPETVRRSFRAFNGLSADEPAEPQARRASERMPIF